MRSFQSYARVVITSKTGRIVTSLILGLVAFTVLRGCRHTAPSLAFAAKKTSAGEVIHTNAQFKIPLNSSEPSSKTNVPSVTLPPIRFAFSNSVAPAVARLTLPTHRLIACKLVNTVDSSSLATPIIGLVKNDVFWQGHLMVPKHTEVHCRAAAHHLRDRVASQGTWTLIWATGEEISVNGIALDMDQQGDHWGVTDGSAGLKGSIEQAMNPEAVKLFFATFLAGMTEPFQQRQNTLLGFSLAPTTQNAALSGVGSVIESYAQQLLKTIEIESAFVRVPSGKSFYLYTLDRIVPPETQGLSQASVQP